MWNMVRVTAADELAHHIAHYNYKGSCGLSRGLKWLAIMLHFSHGEA